MAYIGSKPANKPVVASDLDPAVITGQTALAVAPAATDEFIISDAGVLKRLDASLVGADGITMADQWRITANLNTNSDPISSNLERIDTTSQGTLGTGMTESSGIFSFPSTGIYLVRFNFVGESSSDSFAGYIYATNDNSTYYELNEVFVRNNSGFNESASMETLIDVTNTSNVKVKFVSGGMAGNNNTIMYGNTNKNSTYFTFIRLGDT